MFEWATEPVAYLLGYVYAPYMSFKAIESDVNDTIYVNANHQPTWHRN